MDHWLRGHFGLCDSIGEGSRIWEGRGWLGMLVEGALSTGFVGEILIVSRLERRDLISKDMQQSPEEAEMHEGRSTYYQ